MWSCLAGWATTDVSNDPGSFICKGLRVLGSFSDMYDSSSGHGSPRTQCHDGSPCAQCHDGSPCAHCHVPDERCSYSNFNFLYFSSCYDVKLQLDVLMYNLRLQWWCLSGFQFRVSWCTGRPATFKFRVEECLSLVQRFGGEIWRREVTWMT